MIVPSVYAALSLLLYELHARLTYWFLVIFRVEKQPNVKSNGGGHIHSSSNLVGTSLLSVMIYPPLV